MNVVEQTLSDSPRHKLLVLFTHFALGVHEFTKSPVTVDDTNRLLDLGVVLLNVLLCSVTQRSHLFLRLHSTTKTTLELQQK